MTNQKIELLQRRSILLNRLRQFFEAHGYWEVETPLLSHDTCVDRWLNPFEVSVNDETCYLQTSPEFAMKRLLCLGADQIFQVCKSFRSGEIGVNHNPEFTMVEWYAKSQSLPDQINFVESLIQDLVSFAYEQSWLAHPKQYHFQRRTYESAFQEYAGFSALNSSQEEIMKVAEDHGWTITDPQHLDRDDLLNFILVNVVEPELQKNGAISITDYPASQSALAQIREDNPPVAERFEMYLDGIEICNGYQELTDPAELKKRMQCENRKRESQGEPRLPVDSHLLKEMQKGSFPECSGVALGFDRLVMLCLDQQALQNIIAFPFPEA